jgi:hypothetical protein
MILLSYNLRLAAAYVFEKNLPGQPPMRGREAFAAALRPTLGQVHIEGRSEIKEIHVADTQLSHHP